MYRRKVLAPNPSVEGQRCPSSTSEIEVLADAVVLVSRVLALVVRAVAEIAQVLGHVDRLEAGLGLDVGGGVARVARAVVDRARLGAQRVARVGAGIRQPVRMIERGGRNGWLAGERRGTSIPSGKVEGRMGPDRFRGMVRAHGAQRVAPAAVIPGNMLAAIEVCT